MNGTNHQVKVWDPLLRIFHWALVAAFIVAYAVDNEAGLATHVWAGYLIIGLLVFRFVWGVVGSPYARFSDFVFAPSRVIAYLRDTLQGNGRRYLGHNPAGGWMIVLLLAMLVLLSISGLMLYGADEHAGPLAALMAGMGDGVGQTMEEVHEFLANFTVFLIIIHLAGVAAESILQRDNLVRAMLTGTKRVESGERVVAKTYDKGAAVAGGVLAIIMGLFALGMVGGADEVKADAAEGIVNVPDAKGLWPLEDIIAKAKAKREGQVIEAELKTINSVDVYEIEILDDGGKVWEINYNAKTGELLTEGEEKPSESSSR